MKHEKKGDWANHRGKSPLYKGRQKQREKQRKEIQNNQKTNNKLAVVSLYISVITPNRNKFSSLIKGTEWLDGLKRPNYIISALEIHISSGWRCEWMRIFRATGNQKKAGIARQNRLNAKNDETKGHYIRIKRSIYPEDTTIINIYIHPTLAHWNILSKF